VLAAIANRRRVLKRIAVSAEAADEVLTATAAAGSRRPAPERMERRQLESLLPGDAVHQGFAAFALPLPQVPLEDLIDGLAPLPAPVRLVVLDQATDPRNVGAVLRAAAAFAAAGVLVQDRHAPPPTGVLAKAASGALESVPLVRVVNIARSLDRLAEAGFVPLGFDGEAPRPLTAVTPDPRMALVFGSEGTGLRRLVRERCTTLARIPIAPRMESLNVATAVAIGLYAFSPIDPILAPLAVDSSAGPANDPSV
jgi:23S rRNA (guanosine2251-2'-O)-methyltransferase